MSKGLLDLKTDLKSLKYSGVNGSQTPFVTKDINNPPSNSRVAQEVNSRVDDVVRVTKAVLPTNSRFLENQAKLIQIGSDVKIGSLFKQPLKQTAQQLIRRVTNTAIDLAKTSASTVAQAGVSGTGVRFGLGFRGVNGAAALQGNLIIRNESTDGSQNLANIPDRGIPQRALQQSLGKSEERVDEFSELNTYIPGRLQGVSQIGARVKQVQEGKNIEISDTVREQITKLKPQQSSAVPEDDQNRKRVLEKQPVRVRNFKTQGPYTYNKETRVNLGNQGLSPIDPSDYTKVRKESVDTINALDIQNGRLDGTQEARDLVKFKFQIITPEDEKFLYFRAYLDELGDGFNGNWSETRYLGRGDAMQTYEGFSREINFGFKIAASSRVEMQPLYRKMVYLASATAPTYVGDGNFMRGTFVRVTIGSYLYEVPGVLTSVNYKWQPTYPWEIALQNPESGIDDDMQELPQIMDCSVSFKPIHDFVPETGLKHYITNPRPANSAQNFLIKPIGTSYV